MLRIDLADAEHGRGTLHVTRLHPENRSEPACPGYGGADRRHVDLRLAELREMLHQRPRAVLTLDHERLLRPGDLPFRDLGRGLERCRIGRDKVELSAPTCRECMDCVQ